jgi:bifunctional enzyme CysN/CysC
VDTLAARLPVQYVIRDGGARRYAGSIAAGALAPGDEVVVLPSGDRSTVVDVAAFDGPLDRAVAPTAVSVTLADDLDVGRGDLIAAVAAPPEVVRQLDATVCWLTGDGVQAGDKLLIQHTTRVTRAVVREVIDRLDVVSLERAPADRLEVNDLGRLRLAVATPLAIDPYTKNRTTGGFLLIDEASNATVGAGMVV